jgi:putative glutamine amidotransferase
VQWHPEFHKSTLGTLNDAPILTDFFNAARKKQ